MRRVRMLGLCLMALLVMAAATAVVASPALASCNEECKHAKKHEKEVAKNKKNLEKWEETRKGDPLTPTPGRSTGRATTVAT